MSAIIQFKDYQKPEVGKVASLDDGYLKIATDIQKAMCKLKLAGREWQVLNSIILQTFGWNKKTDTVTNTLLANITEIEDKHVLSALKVLADRKIIIVKPHGSLKSVSVNTNLNEWVYSKYPKSGTKYPKSGIEYPESGIKYPKKGNTLNNNKNTIINSSSKNFSDDEKNISEVKASKAKKQFSDDDMKAAQWIFSRIVKLYPSAKKPNFNSWANDVRMIREIDKRTHSEICELFGWANNDDFWRSNILSPKKLRDKWDQLTIKKSEKKNVGVNLVSKTPSNPSGFTVVN